MFFFSQPFDFKLQFIALLFFLICIIILGSSDTEDDQARIAGAVFGVGAFGLGIWVLGRTSSYHTMGTKLMNAAKLNLN